MNVFVLNTGRCGSTTFIEACRHIGNYTAAHESRIKQAGNERLNYPDNHIEADNRLAWFLGRLDEVYGDDACYVHLLRNHDDTLASFSKRTSFGIMKAYREGIYLTNEAASELPFIDDYVHSVNANIRLFLKDKSCKMVFRLEQASEDFRSFWQMIGAEGDLDSAIQEWDTRHNQS